MLTKVPANLTLQRCLGTGQFLTFSLLLSHHHQEQSLYPPLLSSLLNMGPLGAADTLLSITQPICEAELGPGGK